MHELERLAAELARLKEGTPEREEYLKKLSNLIASGEYRVDSDQLARKLVEDSLLQKPRDLKPRESKE